jgi:hypothetical protein
MIQGRSKENHKAQISGAALAASDCMRLLCGDFDDFDG